MSIITFLVKNIVYIATHIILLHHSKKIICMILSYVNWHIMLKSILKVLLLYKSTRSSQK